MAASSCLFSDDAVEARRSPPEAGLAEAHHGIATPCAKGWVGVGGSSSPFPLTCAGRGRNWQFARAAGPQRASGSASVGVAGPVRRSRGVGLRPASRARRTPRRGHARRRRRRRRHEPRGARGARAAVAAGRRAPVRFTSGGRRFPLTAPARHPGRLATASSRPRPRATASARPRLPPARAALFSAEMSRRRRGLVAALAYELGADRKPRSTRRTATRRSSGTGFASASSPGDAGGARPPRRRRS